MSFVLPPSFDLNNIPLAKNPSGAPPNFEHGPTLRPVVLGLDVTMIVISAIFLGIRTWVNCRQLSKVMLDDVFCILGWMLFFAFCVLCMTLSTTSKHTWDVPLSAITSSWLKRNATLSIFYPLSTWCAKIAIFILYLRLFGRSKWIKWSCWLGIVLSTIIYWSSTAVLSTSAFPHRGQKWDITLGMKIQKDRETFVGWTVVGSCNLFLDVFLLVLPMPIVMRLKMSLQKRIGLAAVFLIGILGVGAGILGVYYRVYINGEKFTDPTWYASAMYLVTAVELFVTLIVSCFPACVSFYKTTLRETRFIRLLESRISSIFPARPIFSRKGTSRSGSNGKWAGGSYGTRSAQTKGPQRWQSESESRLTAAGDGEVLMFEMVTNATSAAGTAQSPVRMGEIVKIVDVRQTSSPSVVSLEIA